MPKNNETIQEKQMSKNNETIQEEVKTEENKNVELTLQDLQNLKEIIDVASARGAFKPKEMMAVGHVYTKLENFLLAAANQKQDEEE